MEEVGSALCLLPIVAVVAAGAVVWVILLLTVKPSGGSDDM